MFGAIDARRLGFDDFRRNGLMLPARDDAARRLALPLHRGPHRVYNALVIERVGQIEARWATANRASLERAGNEALFRLGLLQQALRRRLIDPPGRPLQLNRNDPVGTGFDFADLDALAEQLWGGSQIALAASSSLAA